jgi:hypothetical protein
MHIPEKYAFYMETYFCFLLGIFEKSAHLPAYSTSADLAGICLRHPISLVQRDVFGRRAGLTPRNTS